MLRRQELALGETASRITFLIGALVLLAHACAILLFTRADRWQIHTAGPEASMSVVEIVTLRGGTLIRPPAVSAVKVMRLATPLLRLPALAELVPEVPSPPAGAHTTGAITPPHPAEGAQPDPRPFAERAGVPAGAGATIVLRVEVRGDGTVGRVAVDVSSGHRRRDLQAVAYARAMRWIGGSKDGRPAVLWVRYGVRLDA